MLKFIFRWFITLILIIIIIIAALITYDFWSFYKKEIFINQPKILSIEPGDNMNTIANDLIELGIGGQLWHWLLLAKIKRVDRLIKSGDYQLQGKTTPILLLDKLVKGDILLKYFRIPEGITFEQLREIFSKNNNLIHDSFGLSEDMIIAKAGIKAKKIEGMLFPDTYQIINNTSEIEIIKHSAAKMQELIKQLWPLRLKDIPISDPYQALILASIVEKETGHPEDIPLVASVYINRLKINMLLQADPTVIYGMGNKYQGNIRKIDLQTPTPYNTYIINGLPPTPISTISKASLQAVLNPPESPFYYFVAMGNGRSYFSKNLAEHNRAVRKYILNKR